MPRRGRHHLPEIAELARQLAYAPAATRRRQMERIEDLVADLDPASRYPLAFVVYRVSGYRPDADGPLLPGNALRRDLVELVRVLSEHLELHATERGGGLPLADAATRCGVTERTLHRWRHEGLCVHRAARADGTRTLVVFREVLDRFLARGSDRPPRRSPTRFTVAERRRVCETFDRRREAGESATAAATAIAAELDRSREAIRQLLVKEARWPSRRRSIPDGAFDRLLLRAFDLAIPPGEVARRHRRDPAAAAKRCRVLRRRRLRALELPRRTFPTFGRADAGDVITANPRAISGTAEAWWFERPDAIALIEAARQARRETRSGAGRLAEAEALLAVEAWLLADAASRRGVATATERDLDAIETAIRWATLLRARVVWRLLPLVVERAEQALGGPLAGRTSGEISDLLANAFTELGRVLDAYEPSLRSGPSRSLRGIVALALDRRFATLVESLPARRAAARHRSLPIGNPLARMASWAGAVGLGGHLRRRLDRLDGETRNLLERRWGWGEARPHRIEELLRVEGGTPPRLLARLGRAQSMLRPLGDARSPL